MGTNVGFEDTRDRLWSENWDKYQIEVINQIFAKWGIPQEKKNTTLISGAYLIWKKGGKKKRNMVEFELPNPVLA